MSSKSYVTYTKEARTYLPFWDDTHKNLKVGTSSGRARSAAASGPSNSVDDLKSSLQLQQTSKGAPDAGKSQNLTDSNNSEPGNDQGDQIHTVGFYDSNEIPFFDLEKRDKN